MRRSTVRHAIFVLLATLLMAGGPYVARGKTPAAASPGGNEIGNSANYEKYHVDYFDNFYGIASGSPSVCWIVGNSGRILYSADGGKNWQIQASGTVENLYAVTSVDARRAWACGGGGTILHTEDGGATWIRQDTPLRHPIFRIQFVNAKVGYTCGYFGLFLRTVDGGKTWEDMSVGEDVMLRGMYFLSEKEGYVVGEFGTILKTLDGGSTFSRLSSPSTQTLFTAFFPDFRTGYAAGIDGMIIKTIDGGRIWTREDSGVKDHLIGICCKGQTVVAVGLRGAVTLKGPEGKWTPVDAKTLNWISGVLLTGDKQGFAVGAHGTILRLKDIIGNAGGI
jgi:photosystem II stability/assembly factor-like uncharacterized protein